MSTIWEWEQWCHDAEAALKDAVASYKAEIAVLQHLTRCNKCYTRAWLEVGCGFPGFNVDLGTERETVTFAVAPKVTQAHGPRGTYLGPDGQALAER